MNYEQAVAYCNWRSDRVNEWYYIKANKLKLHTDSNYVFPELVRYRLPSKQEWEKYAVVGFDEKIISKASKNNYVLFNYFKNDTLQNSNSIDVTAPVTSYFPDKNDIYNFFGNVAEMMQEKNIAKGGSFIHTKEEINLQKDFMYDVPKCFIGFRCVAEFLK